MAYGFARNGEEAFLGKYPAWIWSNGEFGRWYGMDAVCEVADIF